MLRPVLASLATVRSTDRQDEHHREGWCTPCHGAQVGHLLGPQCLGKALPSMLSCCDLHRLRKGRLKHDALKIVDCILTLHHVGSQVGDKIPDATVYGDSPKDEIKVRDLFAGKKAVVFGVPGREHMRYSVSMHQVCLGKARQSQSQDFIYHVWIMSCDIL